MFDPSQFATPVSAPHINSAIAEVARGNTKSLMFWIGGSGSTNRSAAVATLASCLLGSDRAVAEKLHVSTSIVCNWRHGLRNPGDIGTIGEGNRERLCQLVVTGLWRLQCQTATPVDPVDYAPTKVFEKNKWIRHQAFGIGVVGEKVGKKLLVFFQGLDEAKTLVSA